MTLKSGRLIYLGLFLVLSVTLIIAYVMPSAISVKTETAERKKFQITVSATSTGTVKSELEYHVSSERPGRIKKLYVEEGDIVKKDQVLATLDDTEITLEVEKATAMLEAVTLKLKEYSSAYVPYKEEVESNIKKTGAIFEEVRARLTSHTELYNQGYISSESLQALKKEYNVASASRDNALAARDNLESKTFAIKAQEKTVTEAKKTLELTKLKHEHSFIKSPADGTVTIRSVKDGDVVNTGRLIYTIVTLSPLYIESFIDEVDVPKVKTGQIVNISMDAYPGKEIQGRVSRISPLVLGSRLEARTFEVRITPEAGDLTLKPGMSANIEIITDTIDDAIIVTSQAVIEKDGRHYVYVVKGSRAHLQLVTTGQSDWTRTQIVSGLEASDIVITSPTAEGLGDGAYVKYDGG